MKALWILIFLLAAFGVVGRIDYEAEIATKQLQQEYAKNFHNRQSASMAAKEAK